MRISKCEMRKTLLLAVLLFTIGPVDAKVRKFSAIQNIVLQFHNIGKAYRFNTEDNTTTYLRYLGVVRTKKGRKFKIMTSVWIWGLSKRATNRVLIFTDNNLYVGNYYLTTSYDIPDHIQHNQLIFINHKGSNCDLRSITSVDFSNGIPKNFFRKCKGGYGDIYSFSIE